MAIPDPPTSLIATPGDTEVALTWSAPVDDGGSAITDYEVDYRVSAVTLEADYSFTQADGDPVGWIPIGSNGGILQVIDGKLTTSGTSELNHGAAIVHGKDTTGDWEVIFDFDLHGGTVENGGGINLWVTAPDGGGVGFFIGDYQTTTTQTIQWHIQDVNVGGASWSNITNTSGHPPSGRMRLTHRDSDHYVALNVWDPIAGEWDDQHELGDPGWVATNTTEGVYLIVQMRSDLSITGQKNWLDNIVINPFISAIDDPGAGTPIPGSWTTFSDGTSTTPVATVTGLTNDVEYDFVVRAVNTSGVSANSSIVSATPVAEETSLLLLSADKALVLDPHSALLLR